MNPDATHFNDYSGTAILNGRFRLMELLGSGVFGSVYRALEFALGDVWRVVAVKLTHRAQLSEADAREALQEAFVLSRVHDQCHDPLARQHLIQIYYVGVVPELDGRGCLVMEYVRGTRLLDQIRSFGSNLPLTTARRCFRELCHAVSACHQSRPAVTHGDLKPDNVLVEAGGTLRVLDFGLAKPVNRLLGYVTNTTLCLTYTAPETLLGQSQPRSDIYSLGLIMYEVLTGGGPHLKMTPGPPVDPQWHYYDQKKALWFPRIEQAVRCVQIDSRLFRAVERCCQFLPEGRFQSIDEIVAELELPIDEVSTQPPCEDPVAVHHHPRPHSPTDFHQAHIAPSPAAWQTDADDLIEQKQFEACLRFVDNRSTELDLNWVRAYQSLCLGQRANLSPSELQTVLELGSVPFDELPGSWRWRAMLCRVLLNAAERLPDWEATAAYYRLKLEGPR